MNSVHEEKGRGMRRPSPSGVRLVRVRKSNHSDNRYEPRRDDGEYEKDDSQGKKKYGVEADLRRKKRHATQFRAFLTFNFCQTVNFRSFS